MTMFPQTDWARLAVLRDGLEEDKREVLGELYTRYRDPIMGFLRGKGHAADRAEDLVQDFFLYSIEHHLFEKADQERGRFRNLVLSALNHFTANAERAEHAQVRHPHGGLVAEADLAGESGEGQLGADPDNPERLFLRAWAETLIRRVLTALSVEYAAPGRLVHFEIFSRLLTAPILDGIEAPTQRALAVELGLSEKEVANRLLTARRAYQRLLRAEIALYAGSEEEVDSEVRDLFSQLGID